MSFHELIAGYPWLTKRAARVMDTSAVMPRRNVLAYVPALVVPYAGRLGAGFGFVVMVYIVFVLGAIAVPAYRDYVVRAKVAESVSTMQPALEALGDYYERTEKIPESLGVVGITTPLPNGAELSLDTDSMVLTVSSKEGDVLFTPSIDDDGDINWTCANGEGLKPLHLPQSCRADGKQ